MTAKQLIERLREFPANRPVLAFSSNPEKWEQIEDVQRFDLVQARYGYSLNGVSFPPDGGDGAAFIVIATGMRRGLVAAEAIAALESFEGGFPVVFDPYGASAAHRFVEVTEIKSERFGVIKRSFRDLQDGRDFVDDVYVENPQQGMHMLLLWG